MVNRYTCLIKIISALKKLLYDKRKDEETMTTLDNNERKLVDTDIVISNGQEPIALAGVMGGDFFRSN